MHPGWAATPGVSSAIPESDRKKVKPHLFWFIKGTDKERPKLIEILKEKASTF